MTIGFSDLKKGIALELEGQAYEVLDYERHKMQQRAPVTKLKLRNLRDGKVIERTFQNYTTSFTLAEVDDRASQYLYTDGTFFYLMDMETFDQFQITDKQLGDKINYLKEETILNVKFHKGLIVDIQPPTFVDLEVKDTPPSFKGDTAQGGNKPATLETGLIVQVPMFIQSGERIRVDTRDGSYVERIG